MALRINGDGSTSQITDATEIASLVENAANAKAREIVGEIQLSRNQQRLKQSRGDRGSEPTIKEVQACGETWWIRGADFEVVNVIAMLTPRNKQRQLDITAHNAMRSLLAAMLYQCVIVSEKDHSPYFEDWEDAFAQAMDDDDREVEINHTLFEEILLLAPKIWLEGADNLKKIREEEKENDSAVPLVLMTSQ